MSTAPAISVIIPVFNRAYCLPATLQSVLAQTFTDFEIVIVDDGSTDDSVAVAQSFGSRVRVISQKNAGAGAARNNGIKAAQGRWLAFQDSDDLWPPQKLERQLRILQQHGGSWCASIAVDEQGKKLYDLQHLPAEEIEPSLRFFSTTAATAASLETHPYLQSMLVEKTLVETAGLFAEDLMVAEDTEFFFRLAQLSGFYFLDEPLAVVTQTTADSLTRNIDPKIREQRFDSYALAMERIWQRLVLQNSPLKKPARAHLNYYYRLQRAELACVAGDFALARSCARKSLIGGHGRDALRCAAIWCAPALWQKSYARKWEGQYI